MSEPRLLSRPDRFGRRMDEDGLTRWIDALYYTTEQVEATVGGAFCDLQALEMIREILADRAAQAAEIADLVARLKIAVEALEEVKEYLKVGCWCVVGGGGHSKAECMWCVVDKALTRIQEQK